MATKKKYKTIEKHLGSIDEELLDNSLENIIKTLNDFKIQYPDYHSLRIDHDRWEHDCILYGSRLETDKQYDKRLLQAKKQRIKRAKESAKIKEHIDTVDLKEYERLKKKFG